jgi:hypothetical protein
LREGGAVVANAAFLNFGARMAASLTSSDCARVATLQRLGYTNAAIASELNLSAYKVQRALEELARQSLKKPPLELPPAQLALIARFQASALTLRALSERLSIDWRYLSQELTGRKVMSARRLLMLDRLLKP